ncbi:MAG: high-affinity nickel-transporter [Acidobacteria bacterium]|nr:high-affinity nickel-transporter [Acidobacteriota bacterium]
MNSVTTFSLLAFGFLLGLKHAVDADHLAAVSTIAGERRSLLSSSLVGALWGLGHTLSLLVAGVAVIFLHLQISARTTQILELCVGIMLVALGINALRKLARGGHVHIHVHDHGGHLHAHPHIHEKAQREEPHTHHGLSFGARPLFIGIVHGLAGSAALMLLVLTTISSPTISLLYIVVFGIGSIGGMMAMSTLFALPARFTARRFQRANVALRCLAGLFSLSFGLFMVYEIGFAGHLLR